MDMLNDKIRNLQYNKTASNGGFSNRECIEELAERNEELEELNAELEGLNEELRARIEELEMQVATTIPAAHEETRHQEFAPFNQGIEGYEAWWAFQRSVRKVRSRTYYRAKCSLCQEIIDKGVPDKLREHLHKYCSADDGVKEEYIAHINQAPRATRNRASKT